jgi:hypothetical protein
MALREYFLLNPPPDIDADAVTLWYHGDDDSREIASLIGEREAVRSQIKDALPETDLTITNWLIAPGSGYALDFSLGVPEPIEAATIYVSTENAAALEIAENRLRHLSDITGWRVYSTLTGEFL